MAGPLMRVLVTGGAGYIGSVSVERLVLAGHDVHVLDTLVTGHRDSVSPGATLSVHSVGDRNAVATLLRQHRIEAVLHCAARSLVAQSMRDPGLYYAENVVGGVALLDALREARVDRIVFSSTAAVYGEPEDVPVDEGAATRPVNPYGASKLAFEGAMAWYAAYGLRSVSLRYFNVAGASERCGERHDPETHLIPNLLRAVSGGPELTIFGRDYPTPDGTAVRDYIHVLDLADVHLRALDYLADGNRSEVLNVGTGSGASVREVIAQTERVSGRSVPYVNAPRRPGDAAEVWADSSAASRILDWHPRYGLPEIIESAWRWHSTHPDGLSGHREEQMTSA
jgi:UDP-glucose 4-epimerase